MVLLAIAGISAYMVHQTGKLYVGHVFYLFCGQALHTGSLVRNKFNIFLGLYGSQFLKGCIHKLMDNAFYSSHSSSSSSSSSKP